MSWAPRSWLKLRHQVGYRGALLLAVGVLDILYGLGLAFPDSTTARSPQFHYYDQVGSPDLWAGVWIAAGLVLIGHSFVREDSFAYTVAVVLKGWWVIFHLIGQFTEPGYSRAWVLSLFSLGLGLVMFMEASRPEPPHHLDEPPAGDENRS